MYQLHDKFVGAVQSNEDVRLLKVRDVVQQLPPPHFRTLQYLLNHLARVASFGEQTGMTPKNIAIVWAPNLLRSRDVENGGVGALHVVGVQAVLTEYLIRFSDLIFDDKISFSSDQEGLLRARPKSLAISTPTKLLSLEEARARVLSTHLPATQQKYIEVGGGPDKLPSKYHTVIELPSSKGNHPKLKKSPSGWKSFFSRGWYSGSTRDKTRAPFRSRKASTSSLPHHSAYLPDKQISAEPGTPYGHRKKLRTVKSAESLAQFLKESPENSNRNDFSGEFSLKSSPQVSAESPLSFEISSPSAKSPTLQKHTRSSSHESYFESVSNNMDVISEPSFEDDEHGLFYYVSERMKMLQNSSSWDAVSMTSADEGEKNARKQKLAISDENSLAKYQKLNDVDVGSPSNENPQEIWQDDLQKADFTLDPFLLFKAVSGDDQSSAGLSSDAESADRTVVERYGNAETILVEVHAIQESSSEEDRCSPDESAVVASDLRSGSSHEMTPNDISFFYSDEFGGVVSLADMDTGESVENRIWKPLDKINTTDIKTDIQMEESNDQKAFEPNGSEKGFSSEVPNESTNSFESVETPNLLSSRQVEKDTVIETVNEPNSFSIISPPSPVYPPKSLKLEDLTSTKNTADNLSRKKKQIFIPSPSSPVEEVRKRFELQATGTRRAVESSSEVRFRCQPKDLNPKLLKTFESNESLPEDCLKEVTRPTSEITPKSDVLSAKRSSEPVPKSIDGLLPSVKHISSKYEADNKKPPKAVSYSEKPSPKSKSPQPSLFTQLKIRKLQSLQADANVAVQPVDPWSDPILDVQEDYHPITLTSLPSSNIDEESIKDSEASMIEQIISDSSALKEPEKKPEAAFQADQAVVKMDTESQAVGDTVSSAAKITEQVSLSPAKSNESPPESEVVKRERINRIKEERRAQLREKLKQESFRLEAEEKEKVQTQFRPRKDSSKHLVDDENTSSKDNIKGTSEVPNAPEEVISRRGSKVSSRFQKCISSGDFVLLQNEPKKLPHRTYEDSRKWLSMPPTDIRDKVAMFERSKEASELCRLGPNGKFSQKQSPSALASSFVR